MRALEIRPAHVIAGLLAVAVIMLAAIAFRPPIAATGANNEAVITVSGEATLDVTPDTAIVSLGVERQAPTTKAALASHAQAMQQVIDGLKKAGVKAEDIKTTQFSVSPIYDYSSSGKPPVLTGYRVTNMVTFETGDLAKVGELIDGAVAVGANNVNNVSFTVKNTEALRTQLIESAVKDARAKADAIAHAAGVAIRRVRSVSIDTPFTPPIYRMDYSSKAESLGGAPTPIEPGQNTLRLTVSVVFGI